MISPIGRAASPQPTEPTHPAATSKKESQTKPSSSGADTVQLSSIASGALQEATETPAQTAHEAAMGDSQARRLLAREAQAESR